MVSTTDSARVIDLCREQPPDLVLLDLHMPDPDGFEILRRLEPWIRGPDRLPVLVLPADVTVETRRRAQHRWSIFGAARPLRVRERHGAARSSAVSARSSANAALTISTSCALGA